MIFLYDRDIKGDVGDATSELMRVLEKDFHMENHRCGTIEECVPHLRKDSSIMDLRFVQQYIEDDPDYCDDTTLDMLFGLLDPVERALGSVGKDTVYIMLIPESRLNGTDFLIDSLVSNLNMLKSAGLRPIPLAKSYTRGNPRIAYTFTLVTRNALHAARLSKTHKIEGWE